MSRRVRTVVAASVTASIAALTACSGSGGSSTASSSASSSASTTAASSSAASTSPESAASSTTAAAGAALEAALLTAAEVGTGFTASPGATATEGPLPCTPTAAPLFVQFAPTQRAKQTYTNAGGTLVVTETIATYDAAAAKQTFAAAVKGFACSSGTLGGTTVKIVKRPGAAATANAEAAAWDFTDGKIVGTAAVLRIGAKLAAMSFVATSQSATGVNVVAVLSTAASKVAALG